MRFHCYFLMMTHKEKEKKGSIRTSCLTGTTNKFTDINLWLILIKSLVICVFMYRFKIGSFEQFQRNGLKKPIQWSFYIQGFLLSFTGTWRNET